MQITSYKHYLEVLEYGTRSPLTSKVALLTMAIILVVVGVASSFIYLEDKKEAPIREQAKYLEKSQNVLFSTSQSLDEVLASFQVAGAKVQLVDDLRESSASPQGFFVSLDDLEKSLSKIELLKKNVENQQLAYSTNIPPQKLTDLNSHIISHLENTRQTLDGIYQEQNFIKDVLYASGPTFYLPVLTDESIWKESNRDAITSYYKDTKSQADETLKVLSKLNVPPVFKSYYDTQITYLALLVSVSDKIINTLAQADDPGSDSVTQTEKAYQQLTLARKDNEKLADALLVEKKKIFDASLNQNKFAKIKLEQNSLINNVQEDYASLPSH